MATWRRINDKFVQVDKYGNIIDGGKSLYRSGATKHTGFEQDPKNNVAGTDGFKHNNWAGMRSGKGSDFDKLVEHFLNTGETLSATQMGISQKAWNNLNSDLDSFLGYNEIDKSSFSKEISNLKKDTDDEEATLSENFFSMDKEGTVANDLYNTFKQANRDQYESGRLESQYMEKDLNKMVGMERQNLIDSIREDRKKMLKSGLSQSAIANREIQGMLQGQNIASEMGQGFLGERRNLEQMGAGIDSMSRVQAYESMGGGLGNAYGGIAAAGAGDMYDQVLKYSRGGNNIKNYYDEMIKKQQGKL